jgi:hypothetical protein
LQILQKTIYRKYRKEDTMMPKPTYPKFFLQVLVIALILTGYSQIGVADELIDLNGIWRAGNYTAVIDGSGKSYHYEGRNGDDPKVHYKHEAFLSWSGHQGKQEYKGKAWDVDGWCCGNTGYIRMEVIDENTIHTWSQWFKPNQKEPFLTGDVTLTRDKTITSPRKVVGKLKALTGEAYITRLGKTFRAQQGMDIQYGDWVETKSRSRLFIIFEEERARALGHACGHASLSPNSKLRVMGYLLKVEQDRREQSSIFYIIKGKLSISTYIRMQFESKNSVAGIRGTDFIYEVTPDQKRDLIYVREGSVEVTGNVSGSAIVNAGEQVEVKNGVVQQVKSMNNSVWNRMSADFLMPEPERVSGSLGAQIQEVTQAVAQEAGLRQPRGALVLKVADDSPAERAGILPGDIILEFDGHTIHTIKDLIALVQETPPGKRVKVALWRNRKQKTVEVQIAASATEPPRPESTCQLVISGALDDHYNSNGNYDLSITVNGQTLFNDTAKKVFEHGRPYGKRFDNWSTLALDLPDDIKKGRKLSVQFKHSGSQKQEWIAVDCMELVCGSEKKRYEIGGYANYGARDGAAGIIYGQGSNGWTIQR